MVHGPPFKFNHRRRFPIPTSATRIRRGVPRRTRLGQNFLTDRRVARRIIDAADLAPDDQVLEIGPGRGALTSLIALRCERLVAVELDPELASSLRTRLAAALHVTVLSQDALEFDPGQYFAAGYKLIANLPYYAATAIIRRYLTCGPKPHSMVVMVQREVADNIVARPGRMGLLSVMVQLHGSPNLICSVPPSAFRPRPQVTSAVIRIDPYNRPAIPVDDPQAFVEFAAAGFRAPRKQLRNSLRIGLDAPHDEVAATLDASCIDGSRRPATLSLEEWGRIYSAWRDAARA